MLVKDKYYFIHITKTGGSFIFNTICDLDIPHSGGVWNHDDIPIYRDDYEYFTCIRDPVDWMSSIYFHRKINNWDWRNRRLLEAKCKARTLSRFFKNLSSPENRGIVLSYYEYFLGNVPSDKITYLQTNNLNKNLCYFLLSRKIIDNNLSQRLYDMKIPNKGRKSLVSLATREISKFRQNNIDFYTKYREYL